MTKIFLFIGYLFMINFASTKAMDIYYHDEKYEDKNSFSKESKLCRYQIICYYWTDEKDIKGFLVFDMMKCRYNAYILDSLDITHPYPTSVYLMDNFKPVELECAKTIFGHYDLNTENYGF